MMPHSVLSRRGAFGLAALLACVRPAPAAGALSYARGISSEVLEIRSFGEGICLDAQGLGHIGGEVLHCLRSGAEVTADAGAAPWGWATLENVR